MANLKESEIAGNISRNFDIDNQDDLHTHFLNTRNGNTGDKGSLEVNDPDKKLEENGDGVHEIHPGYKLTRGQRIFASCTICITTLTCVCGLSVLGPTLIDLQMTTGGSSLKLASWLLAAQALGSMLGTFTSGSILERCRPWLQMAVCHTIGSLALALIPLMPSIEAALFLAIASGLGLGFVVPGTLVLVFWVWPDTKDASSWICAETFFYCLGPLVSAAVSAPFLALTIDSTTSVSNNVTAPEFKGVSESSTFNQTTQNTTELLHDETHIAVAYGILACLGVISVILLVLVQINMGHLTSKPKPMMSKDATKVTNSALQRKHSITDTVLIIGIYLVYITQSVFTFSFGQFLVVFTVGQFQWPAARGAFLTSVYWMVNLFGKAIAVFMVRCGPMEAILFTAVIGVNVFLLILVFTVNMSEAAIWVMTVLVSLCSTFCDPCSILWIEKYIGMRGRVAAIPDIGVKSGEFLASPLIGWLAQEVSYISILYTVQGSAALCLLLLIGLQFVGQSQMRTRKLIKEECSLELK